MKARFRIIWFALALLLPLMACQTLGIGTTRPSFRLAAQGQVEFSKEAWEQTRSIVEQRLETGLEGRSWVRLSGSELVVEVAAEEELPAAQVLALTPGVVTFHPSEEYIPPGTALPMQAEILFDNADIASAEPYYDQLSGLDRNVVFDLKESAARAFEEHTRAYRGEFIAVALDGEVLSCPRISAPVTDGRGIISGDADEAAARRLAALLANPPLPIPLDLVVP